MLTIRAMSDGKGYAARHLEHNDYYAEGERVGGEWRGRGAGLLGLGGAVRSEDFEAIREGLDPTSGQFLRIRRSTEHGRNLYDFTFSAPKSVSVLAALGDDPRLAAAHRVAVEEALAELEMQAAGRVRQHDANQDRPTTNIVAAVYHHDTSRELDPQLHTHVVAANLTFDGAEGRWKALQATGIYERRAYLSEVYRNTLAREVLALGYEIESRRDGGFELKGVPPECLDRFSQRSRQRDQAIREFTASHGRKPTDNEVAVLVRETRARRLAEISTAEVRERQRSRLSPQEQIALTKVRRERACEISTLPAGTALSHAVEHVFERVSVTGHHEVLLQALRVGRGRTRLSDLKSELVHWQADGRVLRNGNELATQASLDREREMIGAIHRGMGSFEPLGDTRAFCRSDRLRPEQQRALAFVLLSRDRAVLIEGAAGTGKTAALQELKRALNEVGRDVLAVAPTMSAVEELRKVGFSDATTLERLVRDGSLQSEARGKVLIVDEAGMVSARQMAQLLQLAERVDLRLVLCGDTRQLPSVEAGDALRVLQKESRLRSVALVEVQRQSKRAYRGAVELLRDDPAGGFARFQTLGAVREVPYNDRPDAVAELYARSPGALVVCATHQEIERVTDAIRAQRNQSGELVGGSVLMRHVALGWTQAQKTNFDDYRPGLILNFHRSAKGAAKGESLVVESIANDSVIARSIRGASITLTRKQAGCFDVCEPKPIEVAVGDRLLLTANHREPDLRVTNGEIVTVSGVQVDGRIALEDGRTLPPTYRSFAHGYAITAHRSQGKTVDSVIVSADGMPKELFYVAASRGRHSVTILTSDVDRLRETVGQSMQRKSALELIRGASRGLALARQLVQRAATYVAAIPKRVMEVAVQSRKELRREPSLSR
jgi:conjugative relaxase-like TrwC/TraI family protein